MKSQHGQIDQDPRWMHTRICNEHGHHGAGYVCKSYSRYLKNKIPRDWNVIKKILVFKDGEMDGEIA